jgi:hypothetical protein
MRLLAILLVMGLVGCASRAPYQLQAMSYSDIERITVKDSDCSRVDQITETINRQLYIKGYTGKNPEDLQSEEDRKYNSRAKVVIWSLRIGCNNPNRYK